MNTCTMQNLKNVKDLVCKAQGSDDPIVVFDGEDECLVAMRPAVFERILVDTGLLAMEKRSTLRL